MKSLSIVSCLAVALWVVSRPARSLHQGVSTGAAQIAQITVLLDKGELDAAATVSRGVIADPSTDFDSLLQLGRVLAEHKIFREAQAAFARTVQIDPRSFPAAFNLGRAYFEEGSLDKARESLARSVEMNPASFQARLLLGITFVRLGEKRQGLAEFQQAELLQPKNVEFLKLLAAQCSEAGLHQEAISLLRRVLRVGGAEPATYLLLVEAYARAGDGLPALEAAKEAAQKFPGSPRLNFVMGVRLQALGRFGESTRYFQESIRLDPNFAEAYVALGELAGKRGQYQEAISFFSRALALRADYVEALIGLAENYRNLGDLAHAEQALLQSLVNNPGCSRCHFLLSQIYVAQKQFEKSERERQLFLESRHQPGTR